ncbi:MAG TPA: FHA domain-containing protein [Methylomirabilota bacterium]|nr:FHA domain-containing protein [Methylomirabilota bacterium]
MPKLVLLSEGFTGKSYELKVERTTVGRVADNTFEIPEASVSSHHAELLLRGNEVLVRDLGSTNGTFINGERITEGVLKPGQLLRLGTVDMRLESTEAAPPKKKEHLDHTRIIQGIKPGDLEGVRQPLNFDTSKEFSKKSNKGTKVFVIAAVVVGLVLAAALIIVVTSR